MLPDVSVHWVYYLFQSVGVMLMLGMYSRFVLVGRMWMGIQYGALLRVKVRLG